MSPEAPLLYQHRDGGGEHPVQWPNPSDWEKLSTLLTEKMLRSPYLQE